MLSLRVWMAATGGEVGHPSDPPTVQALDPHANEYMERMKDEAVLLALAQKASGHADCAHPKLALRIMFWPISPDRLTK